MSESASALFSIADAGEFRFARLCFIQQRQKRHTKVLKLSHDLRTQSVECSKLGKTRIIEDANIRLVRNATFFEPNIHLNFQLKSHGVIF